MSLLCSRNSIIMKDDDDGEQHQEQMMMMGCGGGGGTGTAAGMRKCPWTEEEDAQLVRFVRLFGERRWDFLAKVSGLRRTGKSCRLRWVNYLHPGLRRGRITDDEERLIVELHAKWGSRWSRIARSLPGRTDNEIKNFWRTRTRKMALEERRRGGGGGGAAGSSSSASPESSVTTTTSDESPGSPNSGAATSSSDSSLLEEGTNGGDDDEAELEEASPSTTTTAMDDQQQPQEASCYTTTAMDQLWNEIAAADAEASYLIDTWGSCCFLAEQSMMPPPSSPVWDYCSDYDGSLWKIDDEEYYKKMLDSS